MNSANVAGGIAFLPAHSMVEESQSPVMHENFPVGSWEQSVRPHRRPDHDGGTARALDSPGWRTKPVVENGSVPAPDKIPGQTV